MKSPITQVQTNDLRECRYYLNYVRSKIKVTEVQSVIMDSAKDYCHEINNILRKYFSSGPFTQPNLEISEFIMCMERACKQAIISSSELSWLRESKRVCSWGWAYLRNATNEKLGLSVDPNSLIGELVYVELGINTTPSNDSERFALICDFFDLWMVDLTTKRALLKRMSSEWYKVSCDIKKISWLEEGNVGQCDWAWEYIIKQASSQSPRNLQPNGSKEKYLAIWTVLDLFNGHPSDKKLFLIAMSRAWSQKKHRDSLINKKPLNTYLNNDTKKLLIELAKKRNMKIHELLEEIILKEGGRTSW